MFRIINKKCMKKLSGAQIAIKVSPKIRTRKLLDLRIAQYNRWYDKQQQCNNTLLCVMQLFSPFVAMMLTTFTYSFCSQSLILLVLDVGIACHRYCTNKQTSICIQI